MKGSEQQHTQKVYSIRHSVNLRPFTAVSFIMLHLEQNLCTVRFVFRCSGEAKVLCRHFHYSIRANEKCDFLSIAIFVVGREKKTHIQIGENSERMCRQRKCGSWKVEMIVYFVLFGHWRCARHCDCIWQTTLSKREFAMTDHSMESHTHTKTLCLCTECMVCT